MGIRDGSTRLRPLSKETCIVVKESRTQYRLAMEASKQGEVEKFRGHISAHRVLDKEFKRKLAGDHRLTRQERASQQSKMTMNEIWRSYSIAKRLRGTRKLNYTD